MPLKSNLIGARSLCRGGWLSGLGLFLVQQQQFLQLEPTGCAGWAGDDESHPGLKYGARARGWWKCIYCRSSCSPEYIRGGNKVCFLFAPFVCPQPQKKAARGKYSNILRQSATNTHISVTYAAAAWQRPSIINIGKIETHTEGGSTLRPLCIIWYSNTTGLE